MSTTREQLLDAAAELFTTRGFAGTTTRMIAGRVGIRQASLYYHYAGKEDLLADLLATSVRPSLAAVRQLEHEAAGRDEAGAALARLVLFDVALLARTRHNIGTLYLLPEVQHPRFSAFHADRAALALGYGRLGRRAATADVRTRLDAPRLGQLLIQLVEVVIEIRRGREVEERDPWAIADACLRVCGLDPAEIARARRAVTDEAMPPAGHL